MVMKKVISMILCFVFLLGLTACAKSPKKETATVVDLAGNTVSLPEGKILATANSGWITSQIAMLAGADAIGIAPASFKSGHTERFAELVEGTKDIPLTDGDKVSAEAMLAKGVNVFFASNQSEADTYTNAGLTSIVMNYDTTENLAKSFVLIGQVFGGEALTKGQKIHDYILECAQIAKDHSSKTESDLSVYYIAATTQTTPYVTQGEETFANKLFAMCGATQVTSGTGMYVNVSAEFIMEANPDYFVIDGYLAAEAYEALVNDPVLKTLDAVKNDRIIIAPIGILRPCMRPGAETGIGILWLLKTLCPDASADVNVEESAVAFYKDCFGWDIQPEEVTNMLNWVEE
jgi:iron complex transport system substrate-binding protein